METRSWHWPSVRVGSEATQPSWLHHGNCFHEDRRSARRASGMVTDRGSGGEVEESHAFLGSCTTPRSHSSVRELARAAVCTGSPTSLGAALDHSNHRSLKPMRTLPAAANSSASAVISLGLAFIGGS